MAVMCAAVRRLVRLEDGQDLLEYGLLAVLISVFVLGALTSLSTVIKSVFWQPIVQNF
jgi:Flp pilus assembly pilin Flp